MAQADGFLKYTRELPVKEKIEDRINHYNDFTSFYSDEKLHQQAARCMDCGVPFCSNGCPLGNVIPEFNDAVYQKNWKEAYGILTSTNNFPEFTGRICPAPCESACVLGINQPAIAIEEIEKHIIEIAFKEGIIKPNPPLKRSGKKIAIIGSGPAGLAAAAQLNAVGHLITVFERDPFPGGLLRYGIPDFKLEKWVIDRRIELMQQEGIVFKCNVEVGTDYTVFALKQDFDAIVVAIGSTIPRNVDIHGRHYDGIHFAMDFLKQQNKVIETQSEDFSKDRFFKGQNHTLNISAKDKNVVVIGGGDTGSDCIGVSLRQGAKSVTQFDHNIQPPLERSAYFPWPTYPLIYRTSSSQEEGANREFMIASKEFIADDQGNLKAIKVVNVYWEFLENGRKKAVEIEGTERLIPCDLALIAAGFQFPQPDGLLEDLNLELNTKGNIETWFSKVHQTSEAKVFACGDARSGQSLVVNAISEGRECAKDVDEFLMGFSRLETKDNDILSRYLYL